MWDLPKSWQYQGILLLPSPRIECHVGWRRQGDATFPFAFLHTRMKSYHLRSPSLLSLTPCMGEQIPDMSSSFFLVRSIFWWVLKVAPSDAPGTFLAWPYTRVSEQDWMSLLELSGGDTKIFSNLTSFQFVSRWCGPMGKSWAWGSWRNFAVQQRLASDYWDENRCLAQTWTLRCLLLADISFVLGENKLLLPTGHLLTNQIDLKCQE